MLASTLALALTLGSALVFTGCDFPTGGSPSVDIPKPAALNPESDLFVPGSSRTFSLNQGIDRSGSKDTTFAAQTFQITQSGDTLLGGTLRKRIQWDGSTASAPAPASALALLGLNPDRLLFDSLSIPDPGPALRFPDSPAVGWKLDTTVGELRHVRRLTGIKNVKAAGLVQQCWVFTDSTYLGANPVSTATLWMGARGLVKQRLEWKSYLPSVLTGGTFWREITATN